MDLNQVNRDLLLNGEINSTSVDKIIKDILEINQQDNVGEKSIVKFERKPIRLFINSGGGSVYDGLSLVDIIKQSVTPVYTIAIGHAMSMAFWIYLSGDKRYVGENNTLMYHEVSCFVGDKAEGISLELKEMNRLQKIYDKEIVNSTLITQDVLDGYKKRKAEWYIASREAIKLGLADGYYEEV